jgi:hypothetical protein
MTLSPVIAGVGSGFTVTVILVFAWQPLASVAVTVNVVVVVGDTVMLVVVAPLFHAYVLPPLAVSAVLSPLQMTLSPVIAGVGNGLTVTVTLVLAWQPLASVAVTV